MDSARVELAEANAFIMRLHRHHKAVTGHRFSVGVVHLGELVGVAIVGRPVARMVDQKNVAEVTRCCTDGTKNAPSFLYGRCAQIAKLLGFKKIQTYLLDCEPGTSLVAAGWHMDARTSGGNWNRPSRGNRRTDQPMNEKQRWVKLLNS